MCGRAYEIDFDNREVLVGCGNYWLCSDSILFVVYVSIREVCVSLFVRGMVELAGELEDFAGFCFVFGFAEVCEPWVVGFG